MEAPPAWANPQASVHPPAVVPVVGGGVAPPVHIPTTAQDHEAALFSKYSTLDEPVMETILRDVRAVTTKLSLILSQRPFHTNTNSGTAQSIASIYYHSLTPVVQYSVVSTSDSAATTTTNANSDGTNAAAIPLPPAATPTTGMLTDDDRNIIAQLKDWDLWGPLVLCLSLGVILSLNAPTDQAALTFAAVFVSISVGSTIVTMNVQLLGGTISFFQSVCVLGYSVFPLVISAFAIGCLKLLYIHWLWIHSIIVLIGSIWSLRISSIFISLYVRQERRALALYPVVYYYAFLSWLILLF